MAGNAVVWSFEVTGPDWGEWLFGVRWERTPDLRCLIVQVGPWSLHWEGVTP